MKIQKCQTCKRICKECKRAYYLANRERIIARQAAYYEAHRAEIAPKARARSRAWAKAHPERHRKTCREYFRRRYAGDPEFRARKLEQGRIYRARKRLERQAQLTDA